MKNYKISIPKLIASLVSFFMAGFFFYKWNNMAVPTYCSTTTTFAQSAFHTSMFLIASLFLISAIANVINIIQEEKRIKKKERI